MQRGCPAGGHHGGVPAAAEAPGDVAHCQVSLARGIQGRAWLLERCMSKNKQISGLEGMYLQVGSTASC